MGFAVELTALIVAVLIVTGIAQRLNWSPPLCLVLVGVAASFVPGVPDYHLEPEVVLVGLLPPLLYATAIRTPLFDFRANRVPIAALSVGLVVFTTLVVGWVVWLIVPGIPLAAGFALGAVVAPPDAVAATAVARRVGMPRRIVRILEGESLLNDAAALVGLRTAIAAIAGAVSLGEVGGDFLLAAGGGAVVGLLVGWAANLLRRRLTDPVADTAWSFVIPFVAYLPAEAIHGSGVLAVVVAGVIVGHQMPRMLSGPSRLASRLNWRTIQFLLENVVFLLIGLQVRRIVEEVGDAGLSAWSLALICAGVLAATILTRVLWVFGYGFVSRLRPGVRTPWSYFTVISWAGMRGVVTLAAAFVLPDDTPQRGVLVLAAFVVVAGTLLLHGMTLPGLVRRLRLPPPNPAEDALQEAALLHDMTSAGLAKLEELRGPGTHRRSSTGCGTSSPTARTRRGRTSAGAVRWRRPRATRTVGCAPKCWRPSGRCCSRRGTRARPTTRCSAGSSTGWTSRSRCWSDPTRSRAWNASWTPPRPPRARASTWRRRARRPATPRAASTACARARRGCTCGCAWSAGTSAAVTPHRASTRPSTSTTPGTR